MVGKLVNYLLTNEAGLTALVGTKIFPYVINEDTTLPAVIYKVNSLDVIYDKDRWVNDEFNVTVSNYSVDYTQVENIAYQVRAALENKQGRINNITCNRIELIGQEEGFEITEGVYYNRLTFNIIVTNY
jgi:hypothetical protein